MELNFTKYQGTGNDFILVDNREESFRLPPESIQKLCDRKFGIGADGVILIQSHPDLDYRMIYYNADGSQSLCGNGSRCGFAFAQSLGIVDQSATFETTDGVHAVKQQENLIHFQLFDVHNVDQLSDHEWYIDTGSPHHIVILPDSEEPNVLEEGRRIRHSPKYAGQNGTNVNFAQLLQGHVAIRTYERGVEDETLSCGTGATAVALMASKVGYSSPVSIKTLGGTLTVSFQTTEKGFTDIWLAGPAKKVFEGSVII